MTTTYEIPLTPEAQTLSIALAGVTYRLTFTWNLEASLWKLDIADINGVPILSGILLVAAIDLLAPYPYLNFGGQLVAGTDNAPEVAPTFDNLGIAGHLHFITL